MLNLSQRLGEPLIIGDSVIYITKKPGDPDSVRIAVDAPCSVQVLRDDLVESTLRARRFYQVASNVWRRDGVDYTTREAIGIVRQANGRNS